MHLLSAALLERQQTHSETVNERGVAGEVELKVMCILVRAGILQTWHDVLDLRVTLFSLVLRKVMSGVGRERERGFWKYNLQSSIFNLSLFKWWPFGKTKSYTAISLDWDGLRNWGKTQTRGKKNRRAKPSGIVQGGKRVQAVHAIFMPLHSVLRHFFPTAEPGSRVRSSWKQFFCSQKILWNVDASSN